MLRNAGAIEVHVRIASPPLRYPCYMGINIPTREELIANEMEISHIAQHVGKSISYHIGRQRNCSTRLVKKFEFEFKFRKRF